MPTHEIITIINNSGKVISTGKQLVGIFKEAQAAYRDRRDAAKAERAAVKRSKTFDVGPRSHYDDERSTLQRRYTYDDDDVRSRASRASRSSRQSRRPRSPERHSSERLSSERQPLALTEGNLKAYTEVSATAPSKISKPPSATGTSRDISAPQAPLAIMPPPPASETGSVPGAGALVHRPRSDQSLKKKKSIDLNLAYGDIPPDLASRADLDIGRSTSPEQEREREPEREKAGDPQEAEALSLMEKIENFLEEAQCVHDTAAHMIENLQRNPEAAAAVALSLAELSSLLGKMSPAFLGVLKGGSPAVFALLASPQFLIGASVIAGVTVVIFGGLKIIKRMAAGRTLEAPMEMRGMGAAAPAESTAAPAPAMLPAPGDDASAAAYDEAMVLREVEELSSIEKWVRGIPTYAMEDDPAELEELRREAERALKESFQEDLDEVRPCDSVSQVDFGPRRYARSSYSSYKSRKHYERERNRDLYDIPERKSSRRERGGDDGYSEAASERSHRSRRERDIDDGHSEAASERSHRSHRSSSSKTHRHHDSGSTVSRSSRHSTRLKAIEEDRESNDGRSTASGSVSGKPKEKKREMIKQLFKMKKEKEDRDRVVSVMV